MQITIRTFQEGDEKAWVKIVNESVKGLERKPFTIETIEQCKRDPYFDPKGVFFACVNDTPVGVCWAKAGTFYEVEKGHLDSFQVIPRFQGTQIEEMLHEKAITYFKSKGLKEAEIMLLDDDVHRQRFFSSKGYSVHRVYLLLKRGLDEIPSCPQINGLKIQPLKEKELQLAVDVTNKSFSDVFSYYDFEPATVEELSQQMQMLDVSLEDFKIAYLNSKPIGYVYLIKDNVAGIGVLKEHRRKGIGSALLIEGLKHLKSKGLKEALLGVNAENEPALNLFRKYGFQDWKRDIFMKRKI